MPAITDIGASPLLPSFKGPTPRSIPLRQHARPKAATPRQVPFPRQSTGDRPIRGSDPSADQAAGRCRKHGVDRADSVPAAEHRDGHSRGPAAETRLGVNEEEHPAAEKKCGRMSSRSATRRSSDGQLCRRLDERGLVLVVPQRGLPLVRARNPVLEACYGRLIATAREPDTILDAVIRAQKPWQTARAPRQPLPTPGDMTAPRCGKIKINFISRREVSRPRFSGGFRL